MPVVRETIYRVWCDGTRGLANAGNSACLASQDGDHPSAGEAAAHAEDEGWERIGVKFYCPGCRAMREATKTAAQD